jgi:hypothetical protein
VAKANFQGRNDMTALHYAAQQGDPSVVTLLLKHGADRRMRDASNRTAHDMASERSFAAVVKLLENDPTAVSVCAAAATGTWDDAASMFAQGESVNAKHVVVATEGAVGWREQKFFPFVRSQHLVGGVVESKTTRHEIFTPLIAACSHNREDVLEKLLEFEELELDGVNLKGQSALMYAAACGNVGLILKLLRRGSDRTLKDDKVRGGEGGRGGGSAKERGGGAKRVRMKEAGTKREQKKEMLALASAVSVGCRWAALAPLCARFTRANARLRTGRRWTGPR